MAGQDDGDPPPKVVESLVLGVVNWWSGKFHRNQVLNLVTRHFLPMEVFEANMQLAKASQIEVPGKKNNTPSRSACEAYAIDLVNNLLELDSQKKKPRILIPSDQLGKVPLDAIAVSEERSVSARLESLEQCVKEVTTNMHRLLNSSDRESAVMPQMPVPSAPPAEDVLQPLVCQSYATTAAAVLPLQPVEQRAGGGHLQPPQQNRERSKSPSVKRKHGESEGDEGFRRQGRPRKTAVGASKVKVDGVGDYQPSLQYYIGNTPGKASPEVIKKVLAKCSEPLLTEGQLEIEEIELLTLEDNPRTKCWRIVVPYKHMSLMENPELYPEGWRSRKFFGSRKGKDKNKNQRLDGDVVDEIMREVENEDRKRNGSQSGSHSQTDGSSGVGNNP